MTTTSLAITEKVCKFIHAHVRHRRCTRQVYVRALRGRSPRSSSISQEESRELCSSRLHFRPEFRDDMESSGRQQYIALAIPVVGQSLVAHQFSSGSHSSLLFAYDDVVSMQSGEGEGEKANNCIRGMASQINIQTYVSPPQTQYLGRRRLLQVLLTKARNKQNKRSDPFFP